MKVLVADPDGRAALGPDIGPADARPVGRDRSALGVEVDRTGMQGLMQVADEVRQHQQRLLLVANREGRRRRATFQHIDRRADGAHDVVRAGPGEALPIGAALHVDVGEVVGLVAAMAGARARAIAPVALHVVFHARDLGRRHEGLAPVLVARGGIVDEAAAGPAIDRPHTVGPLGRRLEIVAEQLLDVPARVGRQQPVGDGADQLMARRIPAPGWARHDQEGQEGHEGQQQAKPSHGTRLLEWRHRVSRGSTTPSCAA